jgi:DNA polymerase-3 subunit delta
LRAVDELLAEIAAGRLEPIYVLHSEHPILLDRVIAALRDAAVPPAARGFNYDVVEGKPTGARIVALAQTLPMMAQRRMIYVRDLSAMAADDAEPLLAYLARPNPSTVVVAVAAKIDKRIKLYGTLARKGYLHVLEAPRQIAPWLRAEAKQQGVQLEPAAVTRLIDAVGDDLSRLALTVGQLGLYASAGGRAVTSDDVDELVADTRERTVFELTDAIGAADRPRALAAVGALCDQRESAVGVVVMLARHVRQMTLVYNLRETGAPRAGWGPMLGVPPFVVDKLVAQARRYSPVALATATRRLANADRALKGDITLTSTPPTPDSMFTGPQIKALGKDLAERVVLERLVTGIIGLAA